MGEPRQALVGEGRIVGHKLRVAVGRQIDAREALVIQGVREWQRDGDDRIVPVIAGVRCSRHNATADLTEHVRTDARRRG